MVLSVSVDFPGVEVIDLTSPTDIVSPYGVGIILGSAKKGVTTLKLVSSVEDFITEFGDDSPSLKYIQAFFSNLLNSSIRLYFFRVNSGTGGTATVATPTMYITAIGTLDPQFNPGGLIAAPEAFETFSAVANVADRKNIANAMKTFCDFDSGSMWLAIGDIHPLITNITDAVAEAKATFVASRGEIFVYAPFYKLADDTTILLPSAARMAITLSLWASGAYYTVPAGKKYPIKDAASLGYVVPKNQRTIAHTGNVNLIRYFENYGYAADDSITVSTNKEYYQINSVVCYRIVAYLIEQAVEEFIHEPIAGNADLLLRVESAVNRTCFDAWNSKYLVGNISGEDAQRAFKVTADVNSLPDPSNAVLEVMTEVRPAYSLQKVVIYIRNILGQSTALENITAA